MTSTQDLVLGAVARKTPKRKDNRKKKQRTSRIGKKRLHIFLDESKLAFNRWEEVPKPWSFKTCEAYIEWCHIGRDFPHEHYMKQCKADKAKLYFCQWPIFKERCIEMCHHIYEKPFLERNICPLSILQMVYAEVVLGKNVNWMTINIQTKSNMKVPLTSYFGLRRKFPHGGLGKKMPSTEISNDLVVHLDTSSDDKKTSCIPTEKRAILASIKGKVVHNTVRYSAIYGISYRYHRCGTVYMLEDKGKCSGSSLRMAFRIFRCYRALKPTVVSLDTSFEDLKPT
jgi:hypothetical protein